MNWGQQYNLATPRVSKNDRSLDIQVQKLSAADCDEIFKEKISVAKNDRSQLKLMLSKLRQGDTVCVVRWDRLDQRMIKLVEFINEFKAKGIQFISLEDNIDIIPIGMLLFNKCTELSEMERELICEPIKTGVSTTHAKWHKNGGESH